MLDAITRRTPWPIALALAFAFVLPAPGHAAGEMSRSTAYFASPTGHEHRTGCPLVASRAQAAPARAQKAAPAQPETTADGARHDGAGFAADIAVRPGVAPRAAPVPSVPLYLLTLRLRR